MIILGILFLCITFVLLKDLHITIYDWAHTKMEEYDFEVQVWMVILMFLLYSIPFLNIALFLGFIIHFIIHACWDPRNCSGVTHVFNLNKSNFIIKFLTKKL